MEVLFYALFALLLFAVPFVLPIISWVSARRTRARVEELATALADQEGTIAALKAQIAQLRAAPATAAPVTAPPPVPAPLVVAPPPVVAEPRVPTPEPRVPASAEASASAKATADKTAGKPSPEPRVPASAEASASAKATADKTEGKLGPEWAVPPPVPPRPPAPSEPPEPPEPPSGGFLSGFDFERLVGVKLFAAGAGFTLVVAAIFFLKYSIEHGLLQPPVRVLIGIAVAVGLLVACELKAARKYPATANALDAAAIAILFATFFSAHALWKLIPASAAFGLLAMVTALAVILSIRRESLFIAVLGLLGGFSTPVLLSTGENRPIPLFSYLLLLNVGLAWVAYKKSWPVLTLLTFILTTVYQWGWIMNFLLEASDLSLAMGIFIVFPLVTFAGVLISRRPTLADAKTTTDAVFEQTALVAAVVPVMFSVYLAAVPAYGTRAGLLFGFLLLIDLGLLAIAIARRQPLLHSVAAFSTLLVMAVWLAVSYVTDARLTTIAFTSVFVLLYLGAPVVAARFGKSLDEGFPAEYVAPCLLLAFAVLAAIEPAFAAPWALFGTLLALTLACAWRAIASGRGFLYYIAAFFAIATQAIWAVKYLTLETLGTAVTIFAIFGVASIGVPVVARRTHRPLKPVGGGGLVLFASLFLLLYLSAGPIAPAALWALALLLAILNAGLFVESAGAKLPALSIAGSVMSWVILAIWWIQAAGSVGVLSSLTVLVGLTLLMLAGHSLSHRRNTEETQEILPLFSSGLFLGLGGHLFLFALALNRQWSIPPWPLFGSLAVITLATSAAALYSRVAVLHAAGALASGAVIASWTLALAVDGAPWALVALVAAAVVSAYALVWIRVFAPRGAIVVASAGAAAALLVGEITAVLAGAHQARPHIGLIVAAHVANVSTLLALTWVRQWRHFTLVVALVAAAASFAFGEPWHDHFVLAAALYLVFVAFPLVLGPRAATAREPFLAAIVASGTFFVVGRDTLRDGGYESVIGALPVVEAAVLAVLLRRLLRLQTEGSRDLGRLALVAGAALAFVTVAIPLQLDHQWITIGWALEGAALAWLFTRIPHRGLLYATVALLGVVFVRLALNPEIFRYEPRGELRILNWYLYAYLIAAASMFIAAWFLSRSDDRLFNTPVRPSRFFPAAGVILLFLLLNIEIADYYATGPEIMFRFGAGVSQDLTYTIGWLVFGDPAARRRYLSAEPAGTGHRGGSDRRDSVQVLPLRPSRVRRALPRRVPRWTRHRPGARVDRPAEVRAREAEGCPIMMRRTLVLVVAAASLGAAAALAQSPRFRYERPIQTEGIGPHRLAVDAGLLLGTARARDNRLSDLRLFEVSGREVPYLLVFPDAVAAQWLGTSLLPIAATEKTSGFEADLGRVEVVDSIQVEGLPAPFLKRLVLEGSGDRERWTLLAAEGTLFDLPAEQLRQKYIPFPAAPYRFLRITWNDTNSGRLPLPRALFARRARVEQVDPPPVVMEATFEQRPSEPGRSRYRVRLPVPRPTGRRGDAGRRWKSRLPERGGDGSTSSRRPGRPPGNWPRHPFARRSRRHHRRGASDPSERAPQRTTPRPRGRRRQQSAARVDACRSRDGAIPLDLFRSDGESHCRSLRRWLFAGPAVRPRGDPRLDTSGKDSGCQMERGARDDGAICRTGPRRRRCRMPAPPRSVRLPFPSKVADMAPGSWPCRSTPQCSPTAAARAWIRGRPDRRRFAPADSVPARTTGGAVIASVVAPEARRQGT